MMAHFCKTALLFAHWKRSYNLPNQIRWKFEIEIDGFIIAATNSFFSSSLPMAAAQTTFQFISSKASIQASSWRILSRCNRRKIKIYTVFDSCYELCNSYLLQWAELSIPVLQIIVMPMQRPKTYKAAWKIEGKIYKGIKMVKNSFDFVICRKFERFFSCCCIQMHIKVF